MSTSGGFFLFTSSICSTIFPTGTAGGASSSISPLRWAGPLQGFGCPPLQWTSMQRIHLIFFLWSFLSCYFFEILVLWQAPHFWYVWKYILSSVLSVSSSKCFHGLCSEFMFFSVFLSGYNFGLIILHENLRLGLCIGSLKSACKSWVHFAFA